MLPIALFAREGGLIGESDGAASSQTTGRMSGRNGSVQIVGRVSGRRSWSLEQKLRIIGEAFSPGSSVTQASERHEVSTGQLYTWRKQLLDGELCGPGSGGFAHLSGLRPHRYAQGL
jgi:Transposase